MPKAQQPDTTVQGAAGTATLSACSSAWGWTLKVRFSWWRPFLALSGRDRRDTVSQPGKIWQRIEGPPAPPAPLELDGGLATQGVPRFGKPALIQFAPPQTGRAATPEKPPPRAPNPNPGEQGGRDGASVLPEVAESGPSPSEGDPTRLHRGHRKVSLRDGPRGSLVTASPGRGGREVRRGWCLSHQPPPQASQGTELPSGTTAEETSRLQGVTTLMVTRTVRGIS